MKYEITKEQIKELHQDAFNCQKKKIESWFPDVFKNTLEVGKWYKLKEEENNGSILICITDLQKGKAYGRTYKGNWTTEDENQDWTFGRQPYRWTPATDTEVSEMLIKEAKKRGYKDGVSVRSFVHDTILTISGLDNNNIEYLGSYYDKLHFGVGLEISSACVVVYEKGKWATIVEQPTEMTHDEIEKALGKKIKIVNK